MQKNEQNAHQNCSFWRTSSTKYNDSSVTFLYDKEKQQIKEAGTSKWSEFLLRKWLKQSIS